MDADSPGARNKGYLEKRDPQQGIYIVDAGTLILIKQTGRVRDYSVIGALAEVIDYNERIPEIALEYLQNMDC